MDESNTKVMDLFTLTDRIRKGQKTSYEEFLNDSVNQPSVPSKKEFQEMYVRAEQTVLAERGLMTPPPAVKPAVSRRTWDSMTNEARSRHAAEGGTVFDL